MRNGLFWDLAPYSFSERHQSFRGKYFPHSRGQSVHVYVCLKVRYSTRLPKRQYLSTNL